MAWDITVGGVSKKDQVVRTAPVSISDTLNSRSTATFQFQPGYVPARYADIVITDPTGVAVFGGIIINRKLRAIGSPNDDTPQSVVLCQCADYSAYMDWTYVTLDYVTTPSTPNVKTVLTDLIAGFFGGYGITLSGSQVNGATLEPFQWTQKRGSDCVRELCDKTGMAIYMSPTKVLQLYMPGTTAAPRSITASTPDRDVNWTDNQDVSKTYLIGIFGGTGTAPGHKQFTTDGSTREFDVLYNVSQDINQTWPNLLIYDGVNVDTITFDKTDLISLGGSFRYAWDHAAHKLIMDSSVTTFPAGHTIDVDFTKQFPFVLTSDSGASPRVEEILTVDDIQEIDAAQQWLDQQLDTLHQDPRDIVVTNYDTTGWRVGQSVAINVPNRSVNATFYLTGLTTQLFAEGKGWQYVLTATETATPKATAIDKWRKLLGGGSGSGGIVVSGATALSVPGFVYFSGNPQGQLLGNRGSFCIDTLSGDWYRKMTDGTNTGWYPIIQSDGPLSDLNTLRSFGTRWSEDGSTVNFGMDAGQYSGTVSSTSRRSDMAYRRYATSASTGAHAGIFMPNVFANTRLEWDLYNWDITLSIRTDPTALTNVRYFFGLATVDPTNSDTVTGRCTLFRYSTIAGDGGWVALTNDNTGQAVSGTIAAIAVDTSYVLRIRKVSTTIYFSVNDGAETAVTSKVPNDTTNPYIIALAFTNTTVSRSFDFSRMGGISGLY